MMNTAVAQPFKRSPRLDPDDTDFRFSFFVSLFLHPFVLNSFEEIFR